MLFHYNSGNIGFAGFDGHNSLRLLSELVKLRKGATELFTLKLSSKHEFLTRDNLETHMLETVVNL
jgi:hypothetical protein